MFEERIKYLRESYNLTQTQFAEMIGVNKSTVCKWEAGKIEPTLKILKDIANRFHVTLEWLAGTGDLTDFNFRVTNHDIDLIHLIRKYNIDSKGLTEMIQSLKE